MSELDPRTLKSFQSILLKSEAVFRVSDSARYWLEHWNLGRAHGRTLWQLNEQQRLQLSELLTKKTGIDLAKVDLSAVMLQTRIEASQHADNEKLSQRPVRQNRVAIKALPNQALLLNHQRYCLSLGSNLDVDYRELLSAPQHPAVLLVENWEAFEQIHNVNFELSPPFSNPLVVFRGSPQYPLQACQQLLSHLALPVYTFMDLDPAGLLMALSTPHFEDFVAPPAAQLASVLKPQLNHQRYLEQLAAAQATLDQCQHPRIRQLWLQLQSYGAAIPQELFCLSTIISDTSL